MRLVHSARLTPTASFHFDETSRKLNYFPSGDNGWEPGSLYGVFEDDLRALKVG